MFNKNMFRAAMVSKGITTKALAEHLGLDVSTIYRKVENDGNFTRDEINRIILFLGIKDPEPIFFASELTETQV